MLSDGYFFVAFFTCMALKVRKEEEAVWHGVVFVSG
jgi:hypothetical protein